MYCNDLEVIIMYAAINEIKNNKRMGAWGNYIHFNFLLRKKRPRESFDSQGHLIHHSFP